MLYIDGSATNVGSRVGPIMLSFEEHSYKHTLKFMFKTSNNEADYEALLAGIEICNTLGVERLKAFSDSQLVVSLSKG